MDDVKRWGSIVELLAAQSLVLHQQSVTAFGQEAMADGFLPFLKTLFKMESQCRKFSDEATRVFIASGSWPIQDEWTAHFNFLRMLWAADLAREMQNCDESGFVPSFPESGDRESVLSWLCIDHWNESFDLCLKLHAVSSFYSLPFYGLDPVGS